MGHATHQLLDAVGVLHQKTMIFDHSFDPVAGGIFTHRPTGLDEGGQGIGEAFAAGGSGEAKGGVVAHPRCPQCHSDVDFAFDAGDFLGGVTTTPRQKVSIDGEVAHADADVETMGLELVGIGQAVGAGRQA